MHFLKCFWSKSVSDFQHYKKKICLHSDPKDNSANILILMFTKWVATNKFFTRKQQNFTASSLLNFRWILLGIKQQQVVISYCLKLINKKKKKLNFSSTNIILLSNLFMNNFPYKEWLIDRRNGTYLSLMCKILRTQYRIIKWLIKGWN